MKKLFYFLSCAVLALASCTADKDGENGPVIVNKDDILVGSKEVLDPDTQKAKLEQIGNKLMSVFPATEYDDMVELSEIIYSHCNRYFDTADYDWSALEEVGDPLLEELYSEKQKSEYKWEYTYTLFFSNCTGIVTLGKHKAEFEESDKTMLIIEDVEGEDWEAVLVTKDLKTVFLGEWVDVYPLFSDGELEETHNITVEIPKSLTFKVTRAGSFVGSVTLKFDYKISEEGLNYETDRINVSAEIKIDDLVMTLEQASVNAATGEVVYSQALRKSDMLIFSQKLSAGAVLNFDEDRNGVVSVEAEEVRANVEFNLLGELQLRGTCSDIMAMIEINDEYFETERQCERAAERATELIDIKAYYDCTSTPQARIEFEPTSEYLEYLGQEKFWVEPVIVFDDESRYSFDKYFKERDFKDLLENFEDFVLDYEEMVEDIY